VAETCQGVIAIDGKVLRRSFDTASAKSALHMVSAWGGASSVWCSPSRKGDCALALKGNQGTLHADVSLFLNDPQTMAITTDTTVDGDHVDGGPGRIETRTSVVATDIGWLQEGHQWPGLAASARSSAPIGAWKTAPVGVSTSP